ncbi:hypothetical protein EAI_07778 [Harpegnathos saltator]|uniref:Uncharacterized protein n=1 Tax=Harpegnathos saltator TaxID=610380 RepID=E2C7M1_HARSA|nr:hypothetical protein EAI_07778 [Harpegnathos saltator]
MNIDIGSAAGKPMHLARDFPHSSAYRRAHEVLPPEQVQPQVNTAGPDSHQISLLDSSVVAEIRDKYRDPFPPLLLERTSRSVFERREYGSVSYDEAIFGAGEQRPKQIEPANQKELFPQQKMTVRFRAAEDHHGSRLRQGQV